MVKSYKISLLQTFFITVTFFSDIRQLQNQNSKISLKLIETSCLPCLLFNKNNKQLSTSRKTDLLEFADPANQCDQFVFKYEADIRGRRVTRCFHMKMFKFLKD